jgi:hypothetical protein
MQLNMICSESTPSDRLLMPGLSCPLTVDADKSTIRSRTPFEHDILLILFPCKQDFATLARGHLFL